VNVDDTEVATKTRLHAYLPRVSPASWGYGDWTVITVYDEKDSAMEAATTKPYR
jgi:hypothetical protein